MNNFQVLGRNLRISVIVISNYRLVRESLKQLIESHKDLSVSELHDAELREVQEISPADVAVVYMNDQEEMDVISEIRELLPDIRIVAVIAGTNLEAQAAALNLGAAGIVKREQNFRLLIEAIRQVSKGEVWLNQTLLSKILTGNKSQKKPNSSEFLSIESLTAREIQVIALIGLGLKNKSIAEQLCLSEATVRHHLSSIYGKLGVEDRLNLVILAYQKGLIQIGESSVR
jgi:DNA-binding NarL/FixJ family response regulator